MEHPHDFEAYITIHYVNKQGNDTQFDIRLPLDELIEGEAALQARRAIYEEHGWLARLRSVKINSVGLNPLRNR